MVELDAGFDEVTAGERSEIELDVPHFAGSAERIDAVPAHESARGIGRVRALS